MKLKSFKHTIALLLLIICQIYFLNSSRILFAQNTTQFKNYVNDESGTLNPGQISALNNTLTTFDKSTSTQIVVYIISSLNGESLEDLSITLAEKNKIGKKDKNNGVLLLIVKDDRKIRIEVGYGLEGVLTDATCSKIIRNDITPEFKSGKYYEGISRGINAIISVTKGEYTADKNSKNDKDLEGLTCCFGIPIFVVLIFGIIFVFIFTSIIRSMFGTGRSVYSSKKGWGSGWGGGGFGGGSSSSGGFSSGGFSGGGGTVGGGGSSGRW